MTAHIGVSPLTGRIFRGRVNKARNMFVGEKVDVTSDVLRAVIEKAEFHGGSFDIEDIEGAGDRYVVTVTKALRQEAAKCCRQRPCLRPGMGPCDLPAEVREASAPAPQWISVTDRLPAPREEVLVWPRPRPDCAVAEYHGGGNFGYLVRKLNQGGKTYRPCDPTHWMPLPTPPAPADAGEAP